MSAPEVILGVDFGTTNSVVAVCLEDAVEVLHNDIDKRTTPSCVFKRNEEQEVGEAALRMSTSYPGNTIRNIKSVLGLASSALRNQVQLGGVPLINAYSEKGIRMKIDNRTITPEEVVAMILLELKKTARSQLNTEVAKAIIAVPSYFTASQRRAIIDSAYLAGLYVPILVNETTAAAMAYAYDREEKKTVVMVDVGGGGSSVAVVKVDKNRVWVQAHSGSRLPGGEDFDECMVEYLKQCAKTKFGIEVKDLRDCEILRANWWKAKEKLSRIPQAPIRVYLPGIEKEFAEEVKRTHFQMECGDLFQEIANGIRRTLDHAKVIADQVDEVLLIGGSSRIPYLRALIQSVFSNKQLSKAINPDEAVAVGAALMAAKCVKLEQEVLALITEVTAAGKLLSVQRGIKLPHGPIRVMNSSGVEVEQEVDIGRLIPIVKVSKYVSTYEITKSGTLCFRDVSSEIKGLFYGCLRATSIGKKLKQVESHKEKVLQESVRIESKNALENLLRVERGRETSETDRYYRKATALHKECDERLSWLAQHSDKSTKEYDTLRHEYEKRINALKEEQEVEKNRLHMREVLCETLRSTMATEVPDDPFTEKAMTLKQKCGEILTFVQENYYASTVVFDGKLQSILTDLENLDKVRKQYAIDQRNQKAKTSFEQAIDSSRQHWKKRCTEDGLHTVFHDRFEKRYEAARVWLLDHHTGNEQMFNEQKTLFERDVSVIEEELKQEVARAELKRQRSYAAAQQKVEEALSFQVPPGDDDFNVITISYKRYWEELRQWLSEHPDDPQVKYEEAAKKVDADMAELRKNLANLEEKSRHRKAINELLSNGMRESSEFANNHFGQFAAGCTQWLSSHPRAGLSTLRTIRHNLTTVVDHLGTAKRHVLSKETEEESAKTALLKASQKIKSLLEMLGFTEPLVSQPQVAACSELSGNTTSSYAAGNCAEAVHVEHMEVDDESHSVCAKGVSRTSAQESRVVDDNAMLEAWKHLHEGSDQQWLQIKPLSNLSLHQCQVVLESLSEEVAVDTLKRAAAAGVVALLMDRDVTADHELVSLSVRYVEPVGTPVEKLLFVRDKRHFEGQSEQFATSLFGQMKDLCERAGLQLQSCLRYLSAPDCGRFVSIFRRHLEKENCNVLQADSFSEPLDQRVATACYEMVGLHGAFVEALSVVGTFRQKFSMDSEWFPLLMKYCKKFGDRDPWLTYSSSVKFLLAQRKEMIQLLEYLATFYPKEVFTWYSLSETVEKHRIIASLVAFDGLFSDLEDASVEDKDSRQGRMPLLKRLMNLETAVTSSQYKEQLKDKICKACGFAYLTRQDTIHSLVNSIIKAVVTVTNQALTGFQDYILLSECLNAYSDKSKGQFDVEGHAFYDDLAAYKKKFPEDCFRSVEHVLQQLSQDELRRQWPALFAALRRAFTLPLIPPAGPRSATQLREGVRRTRSFLPLLGEAVLPLALRNEPPSGSTLSRAVAAVLKECPELLEARRECISTRV